MISCRIIALFLLLISNLQTVVAQELIRSKENALSWLERMSAAPRQHNFSGTFVYYADQHIETSRIIHKADSTGEREKIEVLDGSPRVVFRHNDEMKCYLPQSKKIYTERRWFRKFFPDYLPQPIDNIDENYRMAEIGRERVAGYESQVISLNPRDSLRYGHQLWIDISTGLLLKVAVTHDDRIVEQFAFADVQIGGEIPVDQLKPDSIMSADQWNVTHLTTTPLENGELKWVITKLPAGFKKLAEMKRTLTEKTALVDQVALTDGLATISVFIESITKDTPAPVSGFFSSRGAINVYVRTVDSSKITTVGEVPLETLKLIGDAVVKQP